MQASPEKRRLSLRSSAPDPKKKRSFLSPEDKRYIFQFWVDFKERQLVQTSSSNSRNRKIKKPPHNDDFITKSWRNREQRFLNISKLTWHRIIKKGREEDEFRQNGRPRTLGPESEQELAAFIKDAILKGHIISRNSIRIWSLDALRSSQKYQEADHKKRVRLVSCIGGDRWCRNFLQRHGIQINHNGSALELPRAQKTQPENLVDFYRSALIIQGEAQVHFEARRLLAEDTTLEGVRLGTTIEFPTPEVQQDNAPPHTVASCREAVGDTAWKPGLTVSEEDFFFPLQTSNLN